MSDKRSLRRREPLTNTQLLVTITICIFIAMYVAAMIFLGGAFLKPQNIFDVLNLNAPLFIVACSLTLVMITGSIDISVAGVIGLVTMCCTLHMNAYPESMGHIIVALLMALGIGLAFGMVQGCLVAYLEIQPFIVTLAGMFFARGMTTIVSTTSPSNENVVFQQWIDTKIKIKALGSEIIKMRGGKIIKQEWIPASVDIGAIVAVVVLVVIGVILFKTRLGRNFYAVGGNSQSALMLGINVKRTRFLAHLISSTLAGLAGFVYLMHFGASNNTVLLGGEMNAIASSIIGGTLLTGGVGNIIGTFFGVMTLATIKNIVPSAGLRDPWWQSITTGAMLGFFIVLQSVVLSLRGKKSK